MKLLMLSVGVAVVGTKCFILILVMALSKSISIKC